MFANESQSFTLTVAALAASCMIGCATPTPSSQLYEARRAQEVAKQSEAPELAPDRMLDAERHLAVAERAFEEDPGSEAERHNAYLATRSYELARAEARRMITADEARVAETLYAEGRERQLARERARLDALEREYDITEAELADRDAALRAERDRRREAEARAAQAMASLEQIASVERTNGELKITLSGAVLFEFGKSELLEMAERKLTAVAEVLKTRGEGAPIVIEGHTDSQGPDGFNLALSKARAKAVRDYLVAQGVDPASLRAIGRGEAEPVASNDSPEGRANNRRVEIMVPERPS